MRLVVLSALLIVVASYAAYGYIESSNLTLDELKQQVGLEPKLVDDRADLLPQADEEYITEYHRMLLRRFDIDYRILTDNNLPNINRFAWERFNDEKVGSESEQGRGLLLVIDPEQNQLRIEVSAGLESVYPDAFVAYLENRQMVPFFNRGRVADGIFATSELIRIRAMEAQEGLEFDPSSIRMSQGAGANATAGIDAGRDTTFTQGKPDVPAADTPEETYRRFFESLANRNGRWDLDIFTPATKQHMKGMISSAAQMDHGVKTYRNCMIEHATYNEERTLAVLAHSLSNRACDPFFLEKGEDGKWRLDLKTVGTALGHTFGNIWYIDYRRYALSGIERYEFGLRHLVFRRPKGEQFEHQGIPYYRSYGMQANYVDEGIRIVRLASDGFMARQGFRQGDLIVQWESELFPHQNYVSRRMSSVRPGLDIHTRVRRGDTYFSKTFKAPPHPPKGEYRFNVTFHSASSAVPQVHYIEPGGLADKLGLQPGDYIVGWQGNEKADGRFIQQTYRQLQPGDELTARVYRDGQVLDLSTQAGEKRKMGQVQ